MTALHLNESLFQKLLHGEKPLLVEFWAPWCGHCTELEDAFEEIAAKYDKRLAFGKININDHPSLAEKYFIELVPTLLIFVDGVLIDFVIAPASREAIVQFIEETL